MLWCRVCQTKFHPKQWRRQEVRQGHCPDCGHMSEPAFHAQGGGIVVWDQLQLQYKFVANPPQGFNIYSLMPVKWGIA